jgi:hypothetical protein
MGNWESGAQSSFDRGGEAFQFVHRAQVPLEFEQGFEFSADQIQIDKYQQGSRGKMKARGTERGGFAAFERVRM